MDLESEIFDKKNRWLRPLSMDVRFLHSQLHHDSTDVGAVSLSLLMQNLLYIS